jgi:hypothetical protein
MKKTKDRITSLLDGIRATCMGAIHCADAPEDQSHDEKGAHRSEASKDTGYRDEKRGGLLEKIEQHMAAAVYAEAGQFESAQEFLASSRSPKTVLLVIEGAVPDQATFAYALNLSKRTKGELDILQVIEKSNTKNDYEYLSQAIAEGSQNIVRLVRELEEAEVPFKVTIRLGDLNQKLFNYARRHKDVSMVILDSVHVRASSDERNGWAGLVENIARQLSIPLITVAPREPVGALP